MSNRKRRFTTWPENLLFEIFKDTAALTQALGNCDVLESIDYVLSALSEDEAKCIRGYYKEGSSLVSLALLEGISEAQVRGNIFSGVNNLRHTSVLRKLLHEGCAGVTAKAEQRLNDKRRWAEQSGMLKRELKWASIESMGFSCLAYTTLSVANICDTYALSNTSISKLVSLRPAVTDELVSKCIEYGIFSSDDYTQYLDSLAVMRSFYESGLLKLKTLSASERAALSSFFTPVGMRCLFVDELVTKV